jgi:hypothetical protein
MRVSQLSVLYWSDTNAPCLHPQGSVSTGLPAVMRIAGELAECLWGRRCDRARVLTWGLDHALRTCITARVCFSLDEKQVAQERLAELRFSAPLPFQMKLVRLADRWPPSLRQVAIRRSSEDVLTNADQFSEWQWITTRSQIPAYPF